MLAVPVLGAVQVLGVQSDALTSSWLCVRVQALTAALSGGASSLLSSALPSAPDFLNQQGSMDAADTAAVQEACWLSLSWWFVQCGGSCLLWTLDSLCCISLIHPFDVDVVQSLS